MSAQLGVGVRVQIGWAPTIMFRLAPFDPRFKRGVIVMPPVRYRKGEIVCGCPVLRGNYWPVQLDDGTRRQYHESVLVPLDGGEPEAEPTDQELEVEA